MCLSANSLDSIVLLADFQPVVVGGEFRECLCLNKVQDFTAMARLGQWYADGRLKPHISATLPLERAADALTLMASRKVTGKVVLTAG
jgi:NADPH2:quinone reductase